MPGPKLLKGVLFGVAESGAGYLSGFLAQYFKDSTLSIGMTSVGFVTCLLYYGIGGAESGTLALILLLIECFAAGALFNLNYLLISARVPPEA
jgi:hypothetical protein